MIDFKSLPKTVGIVGSRSFADDPKTDMKMYKTVKKFVTKLDKNTRIVSGGARGIDSYAEDVAKVRKMPTPLIFRPQSTLPVPERFFSRNQEIVDSLLLDGGVLVAFVDVTDCDGTMYTVRYALRNFCPVIKFSFSHAGNFKEIESTESEYLT